MEQGPKPKPVRARTVVMTQRGASSIAQMSKPENPMTTSVAPSNDVLRKPNRTTIGAAKIPLVAQVSITGVTTPAAAVAPPPRPPCT